MAGIRIALFLLAAGLSTGCLRMTYTLNLKPDGSGTIVQTIGMSKAALAGATSMIASALEVKELGPDTSGPIPFFKQAELEAAAAAMGEGVRFVSIAPVSDAAIDGQTATFAFDDIRKMKLDLRTMFLGGLGDKKLPDLPGEEAIGVTFVREGGRSVLVLDMPALNEDAVPPAGATPPARAPGEGINDADVPPEFKKMMEEILSGFHVEIALNFVGTIIAADAPFVSGSKVTLVEMNFGELMKSAKGMQALMEKMDALDPSNVEQMLTMPGLKVATQQKLRIEFR